MNTQTPIALTVNERSYEMPKVCAIAICLDGCEPAVCCTGGHAICSTCFASTVKQSAW